MKLSFDEIVELIHRKMYVRNGVMLGAKAAAKAILQAEEAAQQSVRADVAPQWRCKCGWANFENVKLCSACGTQRR